MNKAEFTEQIARSYGGRLPADVTRSDLASWLYTPQATLKPLVNSLLTELKRKGRTDDDRREAGYLLERIAVKLFAGVATASTIASFRSGTSQHDLLFRSTGTVGGQIYSYLYNLSLDVLVEAKATKDPVNDATMARFCDLLESHFPRTVSIGIVLSVEGITGAKNLAPSDAHLHRLLHYARTKKPIIVIDAADLRELADGANFLTMMRRKIEALENGRTLHSSSSPLCDWCVLPEHMREALDECTDHELGIAATPAG